MRGRMTVLAAAALVMGCAAGTAGPAGPGPSAGRVPGGGGAEAAPPPAGALGRVESLVAAGHADSAAVLADSLYFAWRSYPDTRDRAPEALWSEAGALREAGRPGAAADRLEELLDHFPDASRSRDAVRALAGIEHGAAHDPSAVRLLLSHPDAVDDSGRAVLRSAAGRMSAVELEEALGVSGAPERDRSVVLAALARELARAGRGDSAGRVARRVLSSGAAAPDRRLGDSVASGRIEAFRGPIVVGAILPRSGRYQVVGSWLRQGIDLALEEAGAAGGPRVRLEVVDEGDDPAAVPGLVRQLEEAGAVVVIGPIRSRALAAAAEARSRSGLALVSPTATDAPWRGAGAFPLDAYALWDSRTREVEAVRDLGRWLADEADVGRSAILFATDVGGIEAALAFRAGLSAGGGSGSVVAAGFDPDSTTFRGPIGRVGAFGPRAVFVAGATAGTLLQLAPQLSYFGARDALLAGGPGWAEPDVVRRLEPSPTQRRVVAAYRDWSDSASGWNRFRAKYETKYRKSLGANVVPGLGYDAARLALEALPADGVPHPGVVARRLAGVSDLAGATGTLSPDRATSTVARRTLIRVLEDRRLAPAAPDSVRAWLEQSGFLEAAGLRSRRAAARQAVRDAFGSKADTKGGGRP
ncbi:MAG TPA: ABC transporter substrate-binding protein [Gemmatimonadota bacterium]|nr:ABC transporter substrate-binding protein [Gemmatimonadota bacterium]